MKLWSPGTLLPLPPVGAGTAAVEALSSYIVRLACAHVVPSRVLIAELLPRAIGCPGRDAMIGRRAVWLNGTGVVARDVAALLERLTLQQALGRLTLRGLHELLPPGRVLSLSRRWCGSCYASMRDERGECWDPLVWYLAPVRWCPVHRRALTESCGACGRSQPWLARDTRLGWCAWCGHDLAGRVVAPALSDVVMSSSHRALDDEWSARVCADLVAAVSGGERPVSGTELTRRIVALAQRLDGGNAFAFARRVGVRSDTPRYWMRSTHPRLDHLLLISRRSGVHPGSLLFEHFDPGCVSARH